MNASSADESDDDFSANTITKRIKALKTGKNNAPAKKAVVSKKTGKNSSKSRKKAAPSSNNTSIPSSNISPKNTRIRKKKNRKINSEESPNNTEVSKSNISPLNKTTISKNKKRKINSVHSVNTFISPNNTDVSKSNISPLNKTISKNRKRKINSEESMNNFTSPKNSEVSRSNDSPIVSKNKKRRYNIEESENFTPPKNNIDVSRNNISPANTTTSKNEKRKELENHFTTPNNTEVSRNNISRSNDSPIVSKTKKRRYNIVEPENFTPPNNIDVSRNNISPANTTTSKNEKRKQLENHFTSPNNIDISRNNRTPLVNNTSLNNTPTRNNISAPKQHYVIISPLKSTPRNVSQRRSSTPSSCESMTHNSPSTPKNTDKGTTRKPNKEDECDSDGNNIPPHSVLIKRMEPQHRDRLFYKILKAKIMELVVQHWLDDYKIDHEKSLREIYQFFIDLASFQHIDINEFLDQESNKIDKIVEHIISVKNIVVMATRKYFLFFRGNSYMKKRERIETFIELFVETCAREKIIFEFHLFKKIIRFIVMFSNSDKRCIRHTGVYLGLKFQTGLVNMEALITRKVYKYQKALENEEDPFNYDQIKSKIARLKNYDEEINLMIISLQLHVFTKNWNLQDRNLWKMRLECLEELHKWIEIFPGRHLQNENISYLVKAMLNDSNRDVRYKAIEIIGKLINNYSGILAKQIPRLIENIAKEVTDVEMKVAAFAIDTLSKIRKVSNLPSNVREILCKYLFCPKYTVAAASGRYLAEIIKEKSKDHDEEGLAIMLLNFEKKCNQRDIFQHQYLVESLYDYLPIFTNISPFITIYKHCDLDEELTTIWVNVVTEIMHITFFGKSSAVRSAENRTPRDVKVAIADRMYIVMWRFLNEINQSGGDVKMFLPIFCAMKGYKNVHPDISRFVQDLTCVEAEENYKIEPVDSEINMNRSENVEEIVKMEIE